MAILMGFEAGSHQLTAAHRATIRRLAATVVDAMPKAPFGTTLTMEVEGHEDDTGDPARLQEFGRARALEVRGAL
jgi:outer membrane protein OmpA-like peptidoglycan-associated protein